MSIDAVTKFYDASKELGEPLLLSFSLTDDCNLDCRHCRQKEYGHEDLSIEDIKKIIDKVGNETFINLILFTGGEPLVRKDFFKILDYALSKDFEAGIVTNGILLPRFAKRLKDSGVSAIKVSLDGFDEISHNKIRGKGSFVRAVKGIEEAVANDIYVSVSTVVMNNNIKGIERMVPLLNDLGVGNLEIVRCIPMGSARAHDVCPGKEEHLNALKIFVDKWSDEGTFKVVIDDPVANYLFPTNDNLVCTSCRGLGPVISILTNGDVVPTQTLDVVLGNALKESFEEIYKKELTQRLWNFEEHLPEKCGKCPVKESCLGGCRGHAMKSKGLFAEDPFCPFEA